MTSRTERRVIPNQPMVVAESVPPETGDHDAVDCGSVDAVVIGAADETIGPAVAIADPEPQQDVVENASSGTWLGE